MNTSPNLMSNLREKKEALEHDLQCRHLDARPLRQQLSEIDREIARIKKEIAKVDAEMTRITTKPVVTDHALIRFLERRYGFSFEELRSEIMTDKLEQAIKFGATGFKVDHGKFVIDGNRVVTYVSNKDDS